MEGQIPPQVSATDFHETGITPELSSGVSRRTNVDEGSSEFQVDIAESREERQRAIACRREGYARDEFSAPADRHDENALILACYAKEAQQVVGTVRLILPQHRPFETESFVSLESLSGSLDDAAEVGRFTILGIDRTLSVRRHLWMAVYRIALERGIERLLMTARLHRIARYCALGFERLNPPLVFVHAVLGNTLHEVLVGDLRPYRQVEPNWPWRKRGQS
jgi:hypothetical protein